jgi:hypothetical protein
MKSDPPTHRLRWKGREFGPLPETEIRRRLDEGEFGLMHEIEEDGHWRPLKHWLEERAQTHEAASDEPAGDGTHDPDGDESAPTAWEQVLLISGYSCGFFSLFFFPPVLGFTGFLIGIIHLATRRILHGSLQIALALACYSLPPYLGIRLQILP